MSNGDSTRDSRVVDSPAEQENIGRALQTLVTVNDPLQRAFCNRNILRFLSARLGLLGSYQLRVISEGLQEMVGTIDLTGVTHLNQVFEREIVWPGPRRQTLAAVIGTRRQLEYHANLADVYMYGTPRIICCIH